MAKRDKEQVIYAQAMEHALEVAKLEGIAGLEREVRWRNSNPLPLHISPTMFTAMARQQARTELMVVATALAMTVMRDMHFPATTAKKFLTHYNARVDEYRYNTEALEAAQKMLDSETTYMKMCEEYLKAAKEESKNE